MTDPERLTASRLRANVYRVLDQVLATGAPVEIERHGRRLRIVLTSPGRSRTTRKVTRLKPREYLRCRPKTLVHIDWVRELSDRRCGRERTS